MAAKPSKNSWLKKNKDKLPLIVGCGTALTLYLGGIIAQATQLNTLVATKRTFSVNPLYCIWANFSISFTGVLVMLVLYAVIGVFLWLRHKDKHQMDTESDERGFETETSGVYGTSKLMSAEEAKNFCEVEPLKRTTGLILGRLPQKVELLSIPPDGCRYKKDEFGQPVKKDVDGDIKFVRERLPVNANRHCLVTGSTGTGKSWSYALPAIFQAIHNGRSVVATDPKGELFNATSEYAKEHGYTVKVFNLASPVNSDSWDALAELKGASQITIETMIFVRTIIDNTTNPNGGGDEVYANGEQNLLCALILFVLTAQNYTGPRTLGAVYDLLCKDEEELDMMFALLPEGHQALGPWRIFKKASANMRGNLILGAGTRIQVLQDEVIKAITGVPDIDLTLPGRTNCIYYIVLPDMHKTFRFISSLFFSCMFTKLVELSRRQMDGRLPISIDFIMDEFITIGNIPDWDDKLAMVRSAGISISMIFQTLTQLQNSYPDGVWETLLSNCYTYLCLACNDMTTAEYISKRSGLTTTLQKSKRVDRPLVNVANIPSTVSHTYSVGERAVMQPAEIIKLAGQGKSIISIMGADILVAEKFPYTEIVDPVELEKKKVNTHNHAPAWRLQHQYQAPQVNNPAFQQEVFSYQKKYVDEEQPTGPDPIPPQKTPPAKPAGTPARQGASAPPKPQTDDGDEDFREAEDISAAGSASAGTGADTAQNQKSKKHSFSRANIDSSAFVSDF